MRDESKQFAAWISRQESATILPNQWMATANIMDRLGTGDLISVLFHGDAKTAMKALQTLKFRHEAEAYWMDEMNATREEENAIDWG